MLEILSNKIPTDENIVTIDDELISDEKHFLYVKLNKKDKSAVFCFSTNLSLFYFAKNLLYFAISERPMPFLEFTHCLNNKIINGVRLKYDSSRFFIDLENNIQILSIDKEFIEIDRLYFRKKSINICFQNDYETNSVLLHFKDKKELMEFSKILLSIAIFNPNEVYNQIDNKNSSLMIKISTVMWASLPTTN